MNRPSPICPASATLAMALVWALTTLAVAEGEDRDAGVHRDRDQMQDSESWLYNDPETGLEAAKTSRKPILIVFR